MSLQELTECTCSYTCTCSSSKGNAGVPLSVLDEFLLELSQLHIPSLADYKREDENRNENQDRHNQLTTEAVRFFEYGENLREDEEERKREKLQLVVFRGEERGEPHLQYKESGAEEC